MKFGSCPSTWDGLYGSQIANSGKKAFSCPPLLLCRDYIQHLQLLRDWLAGFYIWLHSDCTYKLDEGFCIF